MSLPVLSQTPHLWPSLTGVITERTTAPTAGEATCNDDGGEDHDTMPERRGLLRESHDGGWAKLSSCPLGSVRWKYRKDLYHERDATVEQAQSAI
jgi:hypothetical protein